MDRLRQRARSRRGGRATVAGRCGRRRWPGRWTSLRSRRARRRSGRPAADTALDSTSFDGVLTLSADRLTLFFDSNRTATGVKGGFDIWTARRATADGAFGAPTLVTEVNTAGNDIPGWISSDSCRLYLKNDSSSTAQIFVASRQP